MSAGRPPSFSPARVWAMVLRYGYLLRGSWPRLLELTYWPTVQLLTWGFLQIHLTQQAGAAAFAAGSLIGAMMLWDVLLRSQLGFSATFMEEMWSRNVGNLLMSPLRPVELVAAQAVMSVVRLSIGLAPVTVLSIVFFGFNVYALGFGVAFLFANLVFTGWALGLMVSGLILRHGLGAEAFAWTVPFLLLPFCCVYYPVSVLPGWMQPFAWLLPPTYVFEGLRALITDRVFRWDLALTSLAINALLFAGAVAVFLWLVHRSRDAGSLLQQGE